MSISISTAAICFIACHGGPADHFSTFAEDLMSKGYTVEIYATGPALKKFQDRKIEHLTSFALENRSEQELARELAEKCRGANVIITDVGHIFNLPLQNALKEQTPESLRIAYYDNPEPYVPGGYSTVAAKVMQAAQVVLFANANLAKETLYEAPSKEVQLASRKKIGLGFYPLQQAEKIAHRRKEEKNQVRAQLFSKYGLEDRGQKILVYSGGNNEEYFSKAFPAFLQFLKAASEEGDLSNYVILLQQHPGAKEKNEDGKSMERWAASLNKEAKAPQFFLSSLSSDDVQVCADAMLYYQTSMGPQFVLEGIPTIQVGHEIYHDLLVKQGLCATATNAKEFGDALADLKEAQETKSSKEKILEGLGVEDWSERLKEVVDKCKNVSEITLLKQ